MGLLVRIFLASQISNPLNLIVNTCRSSPTVIALSFWTDRSGQTVQTQTRLLRSVIRVSTVCYSICNILTKYLKDLPLSLNFRYIYILTAKFSGVQKFRNFTVIILIYRQKTINTQTILNQNILIYFNLKAF